VSVSDASARARVAVVGAGPAGLVTAIHLARRGFRVTVIDRALALNGPLGEQLSAQGARELARLDSRLSATRFGAPCPSIHSVWGGLELRVRDDLFGVWGPSCIVDRAALERALAEVAHDCGAALVLGERLQHIECTASAVSLTLDSGRSLAASFVVDATGRSARVARQLGARLLRCDSLIALQGRLAQTAEAPVARPRAVLVESAPSGWWYSAAAQDGSLVAIYFTDTELLQSTDADTLWGAALAASQHTRDRTRGYAALEAIQVRPAGSQRLDRAAGDRWLAVGDAAMAWDPLSSSGLTNAILESGHAAATVEAALAGDRAAPCAGYADRVRRTFADYLVTRARIYGSVEHPADAAFWQRRRQPAALTAPIHLHPSTFLAPGGAPEPPRMLAPGLTSATILRAIGSGSSARDTMSTLRARTGDAYLGEELLGALQNLVATGCVTATPETP
jgi:flavin-dependent dehydrogenase